MMTVVTSVLLTDEAPPSHGCSLVYQLFVHYNSGHTQWIEILA